MNEIQQVPSINLICLFVYIYPSSQLSTSYIPIIHTTSSHTQSALSLFVNLKNQNVENVSPLSTTYAYKIAFHIGGTMCCDAIPKISSIHVYGPFYWTTKGFYIRNEPRTLNSSSMIQTDIRNVQKFPVQKLLHTIHLILTEMLRLCQLNELQSVQSSTLVHTLSTYYKLYVNFLTCSFSPYLL